MRKPIIRLALILLICLFIVSSVNAVDLAASDLQILQNQEELEYISYNTQYSVTVMFNVAGDDFASATVDLTDMNTNPPPGENYANTATNCVGTGPFECASYAILRLNNQDSVNITVNMLDISETSYSTTLTKTFSIDNTRPEVTFLGTDSCYENKCYITPNNENKIVIKMQDSYATFEKRLVYYSLAGDRKRVSTCEGMTCYGQSSVACSGGESKSLTITSMEARSQDDAGNELISTPTTVYCDSQAPFLESITVKSGSDMDYIQSGDSVIISAILTDDKTAVRGTANLTFLGGEGNATGTCVKQAGKWNCTWTVSSVEPGPYTGEIKFKFYDTPGNLLEAVQEVTVLGVEDSGTEQNNFKIQSSTYTPTKLNRAFVQYLNTKVYDHIVLKPLKSDVEVLKLQISGCTANQGNVAYMKGNKPELLNFARGSTNPIAIAEFKTQPINEEQLEYVCTLDIYSRKGEYTYAQPEKDNFTITLDVYGDTSDMLNVRVQDEINRVTNKADEFEEKWGATYDALTQMRTFCQYGISGLKSIQGILGGVSSAMRVMPDGGASSEAQNKIAEVTGITAETLGSTAGQVCEFIACESKYNHLITDQIGKLPGIEEMSKVAGYESYSGFVNPDNSILMSYMTFCIHSVLYNQQKINAVDCEYATCLYRDVGTGGLPISGCKQNQAYMQCKYAVGEIFNVVPYTALFDNIMGQVKDLLSNPVNLLLDATLTVTCTVIEGPPEDFCNIVAGAEGVGSLLQLIKNIQNPPQYSEVTSSCDKILERTRGGDYYIYKFAPIGAPSQEFSYGNYNDADNNVHCDYSGCSKKIEDKEIVVRNGLIYYEGELVLPKLRVESMDIDVPYYDNYDVEYLQELGISESDAQTIIEAKEELSTTQNERTTEFRRSLTNEMYDALEIYGDAIDAYDEANLAYSRTRDTELETRDNLLEAQDRLDEVTELLESTPQIDPTDPDVLALYAIVTVRQHELELAQADYEQAQENTKDMKDALDEEMENLADKKEDLETRATFESIWRGEGWSTWFAMHAVIRNVETFTSFILPSDTFADWAKNIDKIFANDVLSVEHRTSTICEQAFDREPASGALISTGDIGYATAAHIEGWRSEPIRIDDNSRIYDYVITGSVYSPKESGLKFEVYANPGNKKILNEVQIEDGEEWYIFNEETALNFTSEEEYNEICIKFTNSEWDLRDYFDEIPDNNQVCNYITGE